MRWSEFETHEPKLADLGRRRLVEPGVVLVVTSRRDGTPRLSPVEPFLLDGEFWLSMLWGSRKAADLLRDPRVLVHSIVTSPDGGEGEYKVRGTARSETDDEAQRRYADAVSSALDWSPVPGRFHLFALEVEQVSFIRYDKATGDQYVAQWPEGREYVRRGTSATSLSAPEPRHDLLRSGDA
jgi:hypothetical protein